MACKKRKFDEYGAQIALSIIKVNNQPHRKERGYYFCADCQAFHITHKKGKR